jgi:hypothetical protein
MLRKLRRWWWHWSDDIGAILTVVAILAASSVFWFGLDRAENLFRDKKSLDIGSNISHYIGERR